MKVDIVFAIAFVACIALIPFAGMQQAPAQPANRPSQVVPTEAVQASPQTPSQPEPQAPPPEGKANFRILDLTTGKVFSMTLRDFVRGAVAAEMPASYHPEALKAQAVAAYTYAVRQSMLQEQTPDPALKGADFAADPQNLKTVITEKQAKEFYGESFGVLWPKICAAADSVAGEMLVHDGLPILAAYHAISAGQTEAAEYIWQRPLPCITPVESKGDILSAGFESSTSFTRSELSELLTIALPGITLPAAPEDWFVIEQRSPSGYVTQIAVGAELLTGQQLRTLLDLRSSCFTVEYTGGRFVFKVKGYGHGAGLSQYGADFMARQGSNYQEILQHYYPGAQLV